MRDKGEGAEEWDDHEELDLLADEASYGDIQAEIYVRQAVERGIEAADRGELVEQEEIERRMVRWLGE